MKCLVLLAVAGLSATAACQKTDATPQAQGLAGEWHWVASAGGLAGTKATNPAAVGVADTWIFRPDSTMQVQAAGQPTQTGTYSLGVVRSIYTGQAARSLTLHLARPQTYVIQELGSRLEVADNQYDGYGHTYQRQ